MIFEFIEFAKRTELRAADFLNLLRDFENSVKEKKKYEKTEFVNITTMHYAKGHQWEHVLIPRLERDIFPQNDIEIDSERRLLYVAISRARSSLTLFAPDDDNLKLWVTDMIPCAPIDRRASKFLFDINFRKAFANGKVYLKALGGGEHLGSVELNVPFQEKEAAKRLGALFNGRRKKWYVPAGMDTQPFDRWL